MKVAGSDVERQGASLPNALARIAKASAGLEMLAKFNATVHNADFLVSVPVAKCAAKTIPPAIWPAPAEGVRSTARAVRIATSIAMPKEVHALSIAVTEPKPAAKVRAK